MVGASGQYVFGTYLSGADWSAFQLSKCNQQQLARPQHDKLIQSGQRQIHQSHGMAEYDRHGLLNVGTTREPATACAVPTLPLRFCGKC
jgi:hypothetical protein